MATRRVTHLRKDSEGEIDALCNPKEPWSPRARAEVIRDIELGVHTYYVEEAGYRSTVHVERSGGVSYLRTYTGSGSPNRLADLHACEADPDS